MPERVRLRRTKGWRMPPNTVKVDRSTKWGNPFAPGKPNPFTDAHVRDLPHAIELYRAYAWRDAALVAAARKELRGKNLACWCAKSAGHEDLCHAAILLEIANQ
jgi:Domain of unknown function (DUF4326)